MNCKQGDIAYVVGSLLPEVHKWAAGHIARCVRHYVDKMGFDCWVLDPPIIAPPEYKPPLGIRMSGHALDRVLRPISNPSDDAIDQSTQWLPPVPRVNEKERV